MDQFDPYYTWLGIPPTEQPPNFYRLLGIPLLESKLDVIANAADRQMAHLRTLQAGKHATLAQKLLNEIATARVCLLTEARKVTYDGHLREMQRGASPPPRKHPPASPPPPPGAADQGTMAFNAQHHTMAMDKATELGCLGEYQLLEKLGEGGMGAVYKALHTKLGRHVAVKVLVKTAALDARQIVRFEREMMAIGTLDNPHIVRASDAREVEGTRFLVMELLDGLDLEQIIRRCGPLPVADACEVVRQAALGLQCAHEHGLIHRDIKPSNLMLTRAGQVKILDLGLARLENEQFTAEGMTSTGQALGTLDYMPPEQFSSVPVDIRADIYSLGCTLYKLLAGFAPFSGPEYPTPIDKMKAHLKKSPPPISRFRNDVPQGLMALLSRMMAKQPAARSAAPGDVAASIKGLTGGSDLKALVARAEGLPVGPPRAQAAVTTAPSLSSGVTGLFRDLVSQPFRPRHPTSHPRKNPWLVPILAIGALAAGLAAIAVVCLWMLATRSKSVPAAATSLVLRWPAPDRQGAALSLDHKSLTVPEEGPLSFACTPGEHVIRAIRARFKPYVETVTVASGTAKTITPTWTPQACLVLQWIVQERSEAKLAIDDHPQPLTGPTLVSNAMQLEIPLEAGTHRLSIERPGYERFAQSILIEEGRDLEVLPQWKPLAAQVNVKVAEAKPSQPAEKAPPPAKPAETKASETPAIAGSSPALPERPAPEGPTAADLQAMEKRAALEKQWTKAIDPAEKLVAAWDFAAAATALSGLHFDDKEQSARLAERRDEVERMGAMKARIIQRIRAAQPPLKKMALMLRGMNGDVTGASEKGLEATLASGQAEVHAWAALSVDATRHILRHTVDRDNVDDCLAAGLFGLAHHDAVYAEGAFEHAKGLGADITRYLPPLADIALQRAKTLADSGQYKKADESLDSLEGKYAVYPWFAAYRQPLQDLHGRVKAVLSGDTKAQELLHSAIAAYKEKRYFDAYDLIHEIKQKYPESATAKDRSRKPSLADLQAAVAKVVGGVFTVRQAGKADFPGIQAAINAASPNSLINIEDDGPYFEAIRIPEDKSGLTIRGRDCWPVIRCGGPIGTVDCLVNVAAPGVTLEHLVIAQTVADRGVHAIEAKGACRLRMAIWGSFGDNSNYHIGPGSEVSCCFMADNHWGGRIDGPCVIQDSISLHDGLELNGDNFLLDNMLTGTSAITFHGKGQIRSSTIRAPVNFSTTSNEVRNSIVSCIKSESPAIAINYCMVPKVTGLATLGVNCLTSEPQFRNADLLDFRLAPMSPGVGKASDGKDLGVRFTPEMMQIFKKAVELRKAGLIRF